MKSPSIIAMQRKIKILWVHLTINLGYLNHSPNKEATENAGFGAELWDHF